MKSELDMTVDSKKSRSSTSDGRRSSSSSKEKAAEEKAKEVKPTTKVKKTLKISLKDYFFALCVAINLDHLRKLNLKIFFVVFCHNLIC
jgi:hypothetical protein